MPVSYRFDGPVLVVRGEGSYQPADLKESLLRGLADPACPPTVTLMYDLRGSTALRDRTAEQVRDMAEFLAQHGPRFGSRLAMVVAGEVDYGLMRMGSAYAELGGVEPRVFRDYGEALAWLQE